MYTGQKASAYLNGFHNGYQEAMQDCADAYERGGAEALIEWVQNNNVTKKEARS